ncbi:hypothetical protein CMK14_07185 [Candidatus Poribacteria bacterium]|nr:hypothetical protein [Candidatus Poribacteria bacterium]
MSGGTPGKLNSLSQQTSGQVGLIIESSPFDPLRHSTQILGTRLILKQLLYFSIFDATGRKVRLLVDVNQSLGMVKMMPKKLLQWGSTLVRSSLSPRQINRPFALPGPLLLPNSSKSISQNHFY